MGHHSQIDFMAHVIRIYKHKSVQLCKHMMGTLRLNSSRHILVLFGVKGMATIFPFELVNQAVKGTLCQSRFLILVANA